MIAAIGGVIVAIILTIGGVAALIRFRGRPNRISKMPQFHPDAMTQMNIAIRDHQFVNLMRPGAIEAPPSPPAAPAAAASASVSSRALFNPFQTRTRSISYPLTSEEQERTAFPPVHSIRNVADFPMLNLSRKNLFITKSPILTASEYAPPPPPLE
jgi:hypothetical protein